MKHFFLIFSLLLLASCNDVLRTRVGNCQTADNRFVECAKSGDALSVENKFRKMYIALVTIPVLIGKSKIVLDENAYAEDHDDEYVCELDVARGTQFNYSFKKDNLTLRNGITHLNLKRTNGSDAESLEGTWSMSEVNGKVLTITELEFISMEEIRIRKICKLE